MDVTARIASYYLSSDNVPDVEFKNGEPVFAAMAQPQPGQIVPKNRKILIYSEFPSMTGLLRNVRTPWSWLYYITLNTYSSTLTC
jgi:TATA-binding protein-associated factor